MPSMSEFLAALPDMSPPVALAAQRPETKWAALSPMQQFLVLRMLGNSTERRAVKSAAALKPASWRDMIMSAFPASPLRTDLLERLDVQNRV